MTMSVSDFRRIAKRRHKYGAERVTVDGVPFASKAEGHRYRELRLLERSGLINGLNLQPRFELLPAFVDRRGQRHRARYYVGDFEYIVTEPGPDQGRHVVEDVKGMELQVFSLKRAMFIRRYPDIELRIIKR
jgi:hypothetical protein